MWEWILNAVGGMQAQWGKATGSSKTTSQKSWEKVQALRDRINKQVEDAESSLQSAYSSAGTTINDAWASLKAKAEL